MNDQNSPSQELEAMVDAVMAELDEEFRARLENLAILILPGDDAQILGEFRGLGWRHRRSTHWVSWTPNQIVLFERPIRQQAQTAEALQSAVRQVLIHELGHYFGLTHMEMGAHFMPVQVEQPSSVTA